MKTFANLPRQERIKKIKTLRRNDLALVVENLSEEQNISAILRSVEAFGIELVSIVHPEGGKPKLSKNVSSGAIKWLDIRFYTDIEPCLAELREAGFKIYATVVDPAAKSLAETNFTGKVALVVGNEASGLSKAAVDLSDERVYLPIFGLTESLNVSVAAAIFLYEAIRQKTG